MGTGLRKSSEIIEPAPAEPALWPEDPDEQGLEASSEWRQASASIEQHGQRLDRALAALAPEFSRNYLQQLIEAGAVQVNAQVITRAAHKVRVGDLLGIELRPTPQSQAFQSQSMDLSVVYEDDHLLVIDKPAGLVVHPAPGHWSGTLLNGLLAHHQEARLLPRAGIVHRLDKDTSGLMVVAKTRVVMDALVSAIAQRQVKREYLALAHKSWLAPAVVQVEQAIGRDPRQRTRMAVVDLERQAGKTARTDVRLLASQAQACLVHCQLHTGRTHQIRVHLLHLGHPLVGDELYGGRPLAGMQRQALHAWRLALEHPVSGRPMSWQSRLPADMAGALSTLQLGPEPADGPAIQ